MRQSRVPLFVVLAALLGIAACSSSGESASTETSGAEPATTTTTVAAFDPAAVGEVTVDGPITGGAGEAVLAQGAPDLATKGYLEEEFFVSGTASSYASAEPLTSDGQWTVEPDESADYTTRILVRRPADPADFNGTVFVEWLNVSGGLDAPAVFTQAQVELLRSGTAWIGVSAQTAGISGEGGLGSALRLQNADPVRYAALSHPGDSFSYDLFSQVGAAVRTQADTVLGGLEPERVFATGESQSAFRLSTYANAIAPRDHVYDGFLIVSRSLDGDALSQAPQADIAAPSPTLFREDLDVPVLVLTSETDIAGGLSYAGARQPDTDRFRGWEVAGTAHYDAYGLVVGPTDDGSGAVDIALFDTLSDPPSAIYGNIISCDRPFNAGPFTYVARSAVASLDEWARTGDAPAEMPRLDLDEDAGDVSTDDDGIALGGIRTPQVDVPIATLSGSGQPPNGFCGLFGTTAPFDAADLAARYPSHDAFVEQWDTAVDAAVESGAVLEADADHLKAAAAQSTIPNR